MTSSPHGYCDSQGFWITETEDTMTRVKTTGTDESVPEAHIKKFVNMIVGKSFPPSAITADILKDYENLFTQHAESINNLTADIRFQILGITKAYHRAIIFEPEGFTQFKTDLLAKYTDQSIEELARILKKHYSPASKPKFDLETINTELDRLRPKLQKKFLTVPLQSCKHTFRSNNLI